MNDDASRETLLAEVARLRADNEQMRARDARFRFFAENASDLFMLSAPDGVVRYVSPSVEGMLGYRDAEMVGHSGFDWVHPDDRALAVSQIASLIDGAPELLATYRVLHKDGHVIDLEVRVRMVHDPVSGTPVLLVLGRDVTARKASERALQRSHALLTAQQEAALDGILLIDEHQNVISYNRRFTEIWDLPAASMAEFDDEALLARVLDKLVEPAAFLTGVRDLYARPTESSRDELHLKDGRVLDRYSAPAQAVDGQLFGRVWYFRDITDRKLLEARLKRKNQQLEELNRLQSNFVHSVAHELRTPLTSIVGYAEFLEDGLEGPEQADKLDYVHQIQLSTQRLQRLLDDLLDFALMEAGTFKLKPETTDLAEKIREITESFRPQVAQAALKLELTLPEEPLTLVADAQRVGQVLTNFIGNAVKLTPGGGSVRVRALPTTERLRVEVADTGPGIAEADIPRLFHRFSQLEGGFRRGGAGLGLAISKGLIEAHGGRVGVESEPGCGSTFWFELPMRLPGPAGQAAG
jgi:PAS domain S-box-containing protein